MTTYDMTDQATVDRLNARTANLMREHGWNAEQALDKVLHELRIAGAEQITETNPANTDGGHIQLYRLADGKHINIWYSAYKAAEDVTTADQFLNGGDGVGFDDQELEWEDEDENN